MTRRRHFMPFLVVALALALTPIFVAYRPAAAADLSDPKAAARSFAQAMVANDSAALHAAAVGTDEQWSMIKALSDLLAGQKQLSDAATAKFGKDAAMMPQQNPIKDLDEKLKDADVAVNGDEATITFKNTNAAAPSRPMKLKKDGGDWKVDLASMNMGRNANMTPDRLEKVAQVMTETADEVVAGKYATMMEAQQAMGKKLTALMRPASAPATKPS